MREITTKQFAKICQRTACIEGSQLTRKVVPSSLQVKYNDCMYYALSYTLFFDNKGNAKHIANLHDLNAMSTVTAYVSDCLVNDDCEVFNGEEK